MSQRELIFWGADGAEYHPVKHYNSATGRSAYRVKPLGATNKTADFLEVDAIEDVARAMLIEGLPARVKAVGGNGPVSVLKFGADLLIRYELAPSIAERLGIPARSGEPISGELPGLLTLRQRFLTAFPDFEAAGAFACSAGSYHDSYRKRVDELLASAAQHPADGWAVLKDVLAASQGGRGALPPFFEGDVNARLARARATDPAAFDAALDALVTSKDDTATAVAAFNEMFLPALQTIGEGNTFRDTRIVPSAVLAAVTPDSAVLVRYTLYSKIERLLNKRTLFRNGPITADEYRSVLALAGQIRAAMTGWGWAPRDLWDVHGFILTVMKDEASSVDDTPIWLVTARDGAADGLAGFVERGEWHLLEDRGSRFNNLVRSMQPGDRIVMRDFIPYGRDLPFDARGSRITALRIRATGVVTKQPDDGMSVGVEWTVLPEPRLWYFYTNNDPVWRLRIDEAKMADMLAAFIFDGVPQDYDYFLAHWFAAGGLTQEKMVMPEPTNLILYGPPGTGKTFATAAEAVRLCGERVPADRDALMIAYRRLLKAGRIEFVTFHQSMAYEDFVEGLRPTQAEGTAGFSLKPVPGVFRRIARRAETSTGSGAAGFAVGDRQVFKMSIGEAANPDDAHLFEEAIDEGCVILGFEDIDWSDPKYESRDAIIAACRGVQVDAKELTANSGVVQMPHIFRNGMRRGDLVVVSKGNSAFRAIGVVTGDYVFAPREGGGYAHKRDVEWLWVDKQGVPVEEIYARGFSMRSAYALTKADLNIPALERYANSQRNTGAGAPEQFVLVIDEINRANISKVFGELITLLEPDKRLGQTNEIKVHLPYSPEPFGVPANLHIIGTMNTADRSIALLDTALRRRFTFRELMPDPDLPELKALQEKCGVDVSALLRTINERIEYLFDREHQIGHAYFLGCDRPDKLDDVMRHKIIPLLAEYFYEDWSKVAAVLGDTFDEDGKDHEGGFIDRKRLRSPFAKDAAWGDDAARYRWQVRAPDQGFRYDKLA